MIRCYPNEPRGQAYVTCFPSYCDWLAWRPSTITIRPIVTSRSLVFSRSIWSIGKSTTWRFQSWRWYAIHAWDLLGFSNVAMTFFFFFSIKSLTLWKISHTSQPCDAYIDFVVYWCPIITHKPPWLPVCYLTTVLFWSKINKITLALDYVKWCLQSTKDC